MNRRGFLGSILALGAAPAIVRADSLMRIVPRETLLITGELYHLDKFQFYEAGWPDVRSPLIGATIRIRKPNRYAGGA